MTSNLAVSKVVDQVIRSRKSVRAFLPTPIAHETILEIIEVAARAPSGSNIQPWKVYVMEGSAKEKLSQAVKDIFNDPTERAKHRPEYVYYPQSWVEPFLSRRRKVGFDLYKLVGIARGETEKMHAQHAKNFDFFGAPTALFFTIPRMMEQGSWIDYGMFLQNILIAANARGIATCPQAAFISYHKVVAQHLQFSEEEQLVCCISIGYEDTAQVVNQLQTERVPAAEFVTFVEK
jgi:nitroreductase